MNIMENNQINQNNQSEKQTRKSTCISRFFWRCAGANVDVLEECPTSQSRYTGMGTIIFFTAVMAFVSMTYALTTVFRDGDIRLAAFLGLLWALMIFSLDRFIVNSMHTDETNGFTRAKAVSGSPRLIMAVFIGIVVSTPLELKIFEQEIEVKLTEIKKAKANEHVADEVAKSDSSLMAKRDLENNIAQLQNVTFIDAFDKAEADRLTKAISAKRSELASAQKVRDAKYSAFAKLNGTDKTYGNTVKQLESAISAKKASGSDYAYEQAQLASVKADRESWRKGGWYAAKSGYDKSNSEVSRISGQLASLNTEYGNLCQAARAKRDAKISKMEADATALAMTAAQASAQAEKDKAEYDERQGTTIDADGKKTRHDGLQERMDALHEMMAEDFGTCMAVIFVSLMFIFIESGPALFKMMMASGAYERRIAAIDSVNRSLSDADIYKAQTMLEKMKSDINDQVNTAMDKLHSQLTKELSDMNDELNTAMSIAAEQNRLKAETARKVNEATYEELARAQAEIIRTAIASWKEQEMQKASSHPEDYLASANINVEDKTAEESKTAEEAKADAAPEENDEQKAAA